LKVSSSTEHVVADAVEVVRRLDLTAADDVHVPVEAEAEPLGSVIRTIVWRNFAIP
jgi:hypothetical protein